MVQALSDCGASLPYYPNVAVGSSIGHSNTNLNPRTVCLNSTAENVSKLIIKKNLCDVKPCYVSYFGKNHCYNAGHDYIVKPFTLSHLNIFLQSNHYDS